MDLGRSFEIYADQKSPFVHRKNKTCRKRQASSGGKKCSQRQGKASPCCWWCWCRVRHEAGEETAARAAPARDHKQLPFTHQLGTIYSFPSHTSQGPSAASFHTPARDHLQLPFTHQLVTIYSFPSHTSQGPSAASLHTPARDHLQFPFTHQLGIVYSFPSFHTATLASSRPSQYTQWQRSS